MARSLGGDVTGQRAAAVALGGGEAPRGARGDGVLVGGDGQLEPAVDLTLVVARA
jgi:hypothetical protein